MLLHFQASANKWHLQQEQRPQPKGQDYFLSEAAVLISIFVFQGFVTLESPSLKLEIVGRLF